MFLLIDDTSAVVSRKCELVAYNLREILFISFNDLMVSRETLPRVVESVCLIDYVSIFPSSIDGFFVPQAKVRVTVDE